MNAETANTYDIVLRLDREDRAMEFDAKERLQVAAYQSACKLLDSGKAFAEKIGNLRNENKKRYLAIDKPLDRIHNTIFIDGERGTGKTAFMLNLKDAYTQHTGKDTNGLYFCQPIDPTLLSIKEDFINVIIGQLHAEIESFVNKEHSTMEDSYVEALEQVIDALESEHTAKSSYGVDRLLAFKGSLELERRLYEYFAQATELLGCKAIVLLIDDVDMSLDVAFNVLEVIRKYLACPFILSVVSGDKRLYKSIVNRHFIHKLAVNHERSTAEENQRSIELASRYMQKIFPEHAEIKLQLLPDLTKSYTVGIAYDQQAISFKWLHERIREVIFSGAKHVDKFWTDFIPQTARDLVQLARLLNELSANVLGQLFSTEKTAMTSLYGESTLLIELVNYFQARDKIALAKSVQSNIEFLKLRQSNSSRTLLRDIGIFNVQEIKTEDQHNHFSEKSLELLTSNIYRSSDTVIQSKYFKQLKPLMINYPAVEPFSTELLISKRRIGEVEGVNDKLLLALYTHHDYFSSYQSGYLIFFGKIFELIFTSLLRQVDAEDIKNLLHRAPYHSFFHYFATKTVNEEREEEREQDTEDPDEILSAHISLRAEEYEQIAGEFNRWRELNAQLIFGAHQLYCVFFKFISNIELLKSKDFVKEEPIQNLHQRVRMILLNATASYEIGAEGLVNQSIALNKGFNAENVVRYDNSYRTNINPLLERSENSLTKAVNDHPVFKLSGPEDFSIETKRKAKSSSAPSKSAKSTKESASQNEITSGGARVARIRALKMQNLPTIEEIIAMPVESAPKYVSAAIEALINDREVNRHKAIYRQQLNDNRAFFSSFYERALELNMASPLEKWLHE